MILRELIYGQVVGKANHYQATRRGIIKDALIRAYEHKFAMQCKNKGANINTPFTLSLVVYYETKKNDLDNSLKTILDCLQQCKVISNDNLCVEIRARKAIDRLHPRAIIEIETIQTPIEFVDITPEQVNTDIEIVNITEG